MQGRLLPLLPAALVPAPPPLPKSSVNPADPAVEHVELGIGQANQVLVYSQRGTEEAVVLQFLIRGDAADDDSVDRGARPVGGSPLRQELCTGGVFLVEPVKGEGTALYPMSLTPRYHDR